MYLRGSKFSPAKPKRRFNPLRILVLLGLIGGAAYVNWVIVPVTPPWFIPTTTPTRSPESFLKDAAEQAANGKTSQAIQSYQEAINADPRNPATYVTLARLQVFNGDLQGATENVQTALLINANYALAKAVQGWILCKEGQYIEAETQLKDAIALDPNSALAYAYLAEVYAGMLADGKGNMNTPDDAKNSSRKALDLDPNLLEVHWSRGLVLESTGNYAEAIDEYKAAMQMNDKLPDLYIAIARNYRNDPKNPDYGQAIVLLNRAIALRPDTAEPYSEQAQTYLSAGDFTNAIQYAQLAAERAPTDPMMHGLLGTAYYRTKDYTHAVKELGLAVRGGLTDKGEQVKPIPADGGTTFVRYYVRYGVSLANLNRCSEAVQVAQQLIQLAPKDETATGNAQFIQDTCLNPVATPTSTAAPAAGPAATPKK